MVQLRGFIAVKPNCSIQSYAPVLTAWKEFEPYEVVATTYQAISGAGKTFKDWPEMEHNIIPYIGGEEEKSEKEPLRLWGKIEDGVIVPATEPVITCQCLRVPVLNGHTAAVFVKFSKKPTKEQLIEASEKLQRCSSGTGTSECAETVYPVSGRRQPSAGTARMLTMNTEWAYLLDVSVKTLFMIISL